MSKQKNILERKLRGFKELKSLMKVKKCCSNKCLHAINVGVKYILYHVLKHFQIHCNFITLEVDRKLSIFCRHDFCDFVRCHKSFFPSLVKCNYEIKKFSPKGVVDTNINFN